jgi:molybdate/tungstate transport system substrate-binding protein
MLRRLSAVVLALAVLAGCGSSSNSPSGKKPTPTKGGPPGTVNVLYAGSLVNLMEHDLGPAFAKASGAKYQGYGAGSSAIAKEITGKVRSGDVFISATPTVNDTLEGAKNGNWVSWYVTFAKAPLLLGYNPKSKFAKDLKSKPWNQVITEKGIRVGRTDPVLDPKGKLTVKAFQAIGSAFTKQAEKAVTVYPEETLVGRLQSGQLDAGFFYANEATEQKIPTVTLGKIKLSATYTVTALNKAKNSRGALAFVEYLLGPQGTKILEAHGLTVVPFTAGGKKSALPAELKPAVH